MMLKTFFAFIFIFLSICYSIYFVRNIGKIADLLLKSPPAFYAFIFGFFLSLLLIKFGWDGKFTYSFQHELTHAAAGVPFGAKVLHFEASREGGKVMLSKSNPVILIAPYIVPLISLLILFLTLFFRPGMLKLLFTVASGFYYGHFIVVTLKNIRKQEEIKELGKFFAYSAVFLGNFLLLLLIVSFLIPEFSWLDSLESSVVDTISRVIIPLFKKI